MPALLEAQAVKRPLRHSDANSFCSIRGMQLSADGTFVVYQLAPQEGDGVWVARNLRTGKEWRHSSGERATVMVPTAVRMGRGGPRQLGGGALFSPDGRSVVFPLYPSRADKDKASKAKPPAAPPRNALGIMDLASGKVTRIEAVRNFQVPEEGPAIVAYLAEPPAPARTPARRPESTPPAATPAPQPTRQYGSNLTVRNLSTGKERVFADVLEYTLSKDGRSLVYAVASRKEEGNGVYVVNGEASTPLALRSGPGRYTRLTWDDKQTQMAFLHTSGDPKVKPITRLYQWKRSTPLVSAGAVGLLAAVGPRSLGGLPMLVHARKMAGATELAPAPRVSLRPGWGVSDNAALSFSLDGSRLFFGVVPPPPPPVKETGRPEDRVTVELWHWKDDFIKPMQKVRAAGERMRTYRAVVHLADGSGWQLADETLPEVQPAPAGEWAVGLDDRPHRLLVGQDTVYTDYHLTSTRGNSRKLMLKKHPWGVSWSPGGRYLLFYDGKDWKSVAIPSLKVVNLTAKLGVKFHREDHDTPSPPPPHGMAGWTTDDRYVLLYDRYDIWQLAPDGSTSRNLTAGLGRKTSTLLRMINLDPRVRTIDTGKPLLLRAVDENSGDTGFYRVAFDGKAPRCLIRGARNYGYPQKARKADVLLLTVSTFHDYPDLFVADMDFREVKRITDANPQKAGFVWGKAELVRFKNTDGVPLRGVLIKPENFDPKKKYPMMVYIYEKLSDRLHTFIEPRPGTSINPTYYVSNGYLVFMPDIVYTVGYPGQSAMKCVLPGIQAVVDQGFVKEDAIGIQGHSWGGYQVAFMVTQTTRFKAASAGAPVSNMTSAYSGIRWGTGLPRQFQYEKTQSRIGGSLWEYPARFLENSPVFKADRVKTPLLMLHNDQDEAVPWYQGIEYYLALRRLGKEVYMFNYPGEAHGLRRRANQKDYTVRLQQFFDHHLKGAPKPEWMEKGLPYRAPPGERPAGRPGRFGRPRAGS
jgi:dienelactone hydrolase